jgi:hypothetical protein
MCSVWVSMCEMPPISDNPPKTDNINAAFCVRVTYLLGYTQNDVNGPLLPFDPRSLCWGAARRSGHWCMVQHFCWLKPRCADTAAVCPRREEKCLRSSPRFGGGFSPSAAAVMFQWIILSSVFSHGTLRLLGNPRLMAGPRDLSDADTRDQLATLIQIILP